MTLRQWCLAGALGFGLAGTLIARLTLAMNPHLTDGPPVDPLLLFLYFGVGYGLAGMAAGLAVGIAARLLGAMKSLHRTFVIAGVSGLLLGPILYYCLLPDVGLGHGILSGVLFGASKARLLVTLGGMVLALVLAGFILAPVVTLLGRATRQSESTLLGTVWILAALVVVTSGTFMHSKSTAEAPVAATPAVITTPNPLPPRLVLLCVDGCDLDDMVLPMVAKGELPTFARLMREGTWGPLQTIVPTLSAVVWTTLITGKTPEQHGIRHFIVFRLPGIKRPIYQFPRHTGLNFRVFPMLERIPGMPALQSPYTSNMRRAEALWGIAGRAFPVGAYRWLVTWPVEPVNGFDLSGGVGWLQIMSAFEASEGGSLDKGFKYPRDVYAGIPPAPVIHDVTREMLDPYIGAGQTVDLSHFKIKAMAEALRDPAGWELPRLIAKFDARFTAADFYNVDGFCHFFATYKDKGGAFSNAVAERYRYADARLGEFLDTMGDSVNVVVVSDHGYDFVQNHHTNAPAGVFFGRGPSFQAGRRVDGLSVYDVAPLCLTLLDLPVAEDMHHAAKFATVPDYLIGVRHPGMVATYETGARRDGIPLESPIDDLIKEQLRSLGYIN